MLCEASFRKDKGDSHRALEAKGLALSSGNREA